MIFNNIADCQYLLEQGHISDGIYSINPNGENEFLAYCDQTLDGGGWTVFQRRVDSSLSFNTDWVSYKHGFGDMHANFWAGLMPLHYMTDSFDSELHIFMETFESETFVAQYDSFNVSNDHTGFRVYVDGYSGDAGDMMTERNGFRFSHVEKDRDDNPNEHCGYKYK